MFTCLLSNLSKQNVDSRLNLYNSNDTKYKDLNYELNASTTKLM